MGVEITSRLFGTWHLVSYTAQSPDGQTIPMFGRNAQGRLILEPGRFMAQLVNPDRPNFASDDPRHASDAEVRAAFDGYLAYYASSTYPDEATIVNHIEAASIPNLVGTNQVRYYQYDGERLVLKTPPMPRGGVEIVATLAWERMP